MERRARHKKSVGVARGDSLGLICNMTQCTARRALFCSVSLVDLNGSQKYISYSSGWAETFSGDKITWIRLVVCCCCSAFVTLFTHTTLIDMNKSIKAESAHSSCVTCRFQTFDKVALVFTTTGHWTQRDLDGPNNIYKYVIQEWSFIKLMAMKNWYNIWLMVLVSTSKWTWSLLEFTSTCTAVNINYLCINLLILRTQMNHQKMLLNPDHTKSY